MFYAINLIKIIPIAEKRHETVRLTAYYRVKKEVIICIYVKLYMCHRPTAGIPKY